MDLAVKVIQRFTGLPEEAITDKSDLKEDLMMDSVTLYEIVSTLESEYGVEEDIPFGELEKVKTVKDLKEAIQKYVIKD